MLSKLSGELKILSLILLNLDTPDSPNKNQVGGLFHALLFACTTLFVSLFQGAEEQRPGLAVQDHAEAVTADGQPIVIAAIYKASFLSLFMN